MHNKILLDEKVAFNIYFLPQTKEESIKFKLDLQTALRKLPMTTAGLKEKEEAALTFYKKYLIYPVDVLYYGDVDYPDNVLNKILSYIECEDREIYAGSAVYSKGKTCKSWRTFNGTDYKTMPFSKEYGFIVRNETPSIAWQDMLLRAGNPEYGITFKIEN